MSKLTRSMALALVMALGLATAACGGSGDGGYSDETREQFMAGCEPQAGTAFCECTLDELESSISEDDLLGMGAESFAGGGDEMPEEVMNAALACIDEMETGG
jgi:hypothetical protein